ncbi:MULTISPECIES: SDR family oxidoreductase [Xanthomonas]|uniref:SDR family oxidoreductase n=1 Tax=Xanthomonas TaxID=338 RepID=UPI00096F1E2F|nr:NAD(P)H-binding protein [Xanthomonas campestris]MCC5095058.1 NAD(P)H-binding protein [Xanthomonas campestris pv. incanae]MEA9612459.1 NAD(P)H-binding protein [Xanthomonas campestris pv. incanae]RFF40392.1 hydroxylase [Xanthomonas campestris pv. incanae]WDJ11156.1 NAD(P)H-binding protein [Xanthomonas campestris pv. incanae]
MTYIIHGASGAQGGPLLKRLSAAGKNAVGAVRASEVLAGTQSVRIDNASVESLVEAYRGADGVFIHLPQTDEGTRTTYARNIAHAVDLAKPGRVVISTSGIIVDEPGSPLQTAADSAMAILIEGVRNTGVSYAVVAPRLYLENLLLPMVFEPTQSEGLLRYPLRSDQPVSWSSHLDVAEVAERLFGQTSVSGVVGVGQLPGLLGEDLATGFQGHLGRDVVFESITPQAFGALIEPLIGPASAAIAAFYGALQGSPTNTISHDTSAQTLFGIAPRSVQQWLGETLG